MKNRLWGTATTALVLSLLLGVTACSSDESATAGAPSQSASAGAADVTVSSVQTTAATEPAVQDSEAARADLQQTIRDLVDTAHGEGVALRAAGLGTKDAPQENLAAWSEQNLPLTTGFLSQKYKAEDPMLSGFLAMVWATPGSDYEDARLVIDYNQVVEEGDTGYLPMSAITLSQNGQPDPSAPPEAGRYLFEVIDGEWKLAGMSPQ